MTPSHPPALRRFVIVALVLPVAFTIAALVLQLLALPSMPGEVAIHWNAEGRPDGFAPAWTQPLLSVGFALGLPLLLALTTLQGLRRGDRGGSYRFMGALAPALSALLAFLFTATFLAQRGLSDPADAPSVEPAMPVGLAAAVAAGALAWFLQPREASVRAAEAAPELSLAPRERAAWFGVAVIHPGVLTLLVLICVGLAGAAVAVAAGSEPGASLLLGVIAVALLALVLTTSAFRIRVDATGITVRSVVGVPRFFVPVSDIAHVAVEHVEPMGQFGGWGLRSVPGRFGIVLRSGPAICVTRTGGRQFVVTCPDAAGAAAVLAALSARESADG